MANPDLQTTGSWSKKDSESGLTTATPDLHAQFFKKQIRTPSPLRSVWGIISRRLIISKKFFGVMINNIPARGRLFSLVPIVRGRFRLSICSFELLWLVLLLQKRASRYGTKNTEPISLPRACQSENVAFGFRLCKVQALDSQS